MTFHDLMTLAPPYGVGSAASKPNCDIVLDAPNTWRLEGDSRKNGYVNGRGNAKDPQPIEIHRMVSDAVAIGGESVDRCASLWRNRFDHAPQENSV